MERNRHARLENWALGVIERIQQKRRMEDSRVELKRNWPEIPKGARRLAGHANAAFGSEVMWLIGVDELDGVTGCDPVELADWWNGVVACFDGVAPSLLDIALSVDGKGVSALVFGTDRAPYVVKNPAFGTQNAGPIQFEVPWREGTSIRTARRNDLIRILAPISMSPEIEFLDGYGSCKPKVEYPSKTPDGVNVTFIASLYIVPHGEAPTVFPFHRASVRIVAPAAGSELDELELEFWRPSKHTSDGFVSDSATLERTGAELIAHGPGKCSLHIKTHLLLMPTWLANRELQVQVRLGVVDAELPVSLDLIGVPTEAENGSLANWRLEVA